MLMQNAIHSSSPPPHGMPRAVVDGDYRSVLQELSGLDCPTVNEMGAAMEATLLQPAEVLSWMYIKSIRAVQKSLNLVLDGIEHNDENPEPNQLFMLASRVHADACKELAEQVRCYIGVYRERIPPRITTNKLQTVHLRIGAEYLLTSDSRNDGPVQLVVDGVESQLPPGESIELAGGDVELGSTNPQIISWQRIGLKPVRVGEMSGILPVPKKPLPVVEPEATEQMAEPEQPKRNWNPFRRRAS